MASRNPLSVLAICLFALFAAPVAGEAQTPPDGGLTKPLDCTLDRDCWIVNVPDAGPGPRVEDHRCAYRTYDGHKGTDFAIRDFKGIDEGVPVVASAGGIVTAARDGTDEYFSQTPETRRLIGSKACGNGVIIEHSGGWETQYCHMRKGSVAVKLGDRVKRGDRLGLIGMSGRTEFPHVHIEIRHNGKTINPFTGDEPETGCNKTERPIWKSDSGVRYPMHALYAAGFTDHVPTAAEIRSSARSPVSMSRHESALVLWAAMFGIAAGDVLKLRILDPSGKAAAVREIRFDRAQAWRMESVGRSLAPEGWAQGGWRGEVELQRFAEGRTLTRSIIVPLVVK